MFKFSLYREDVHSDLLFTNFINLPLCHCIVVNCSSGSFVYMCTHWYFVYITVSMWILIREIVTHTFKWNYIQISEILKHTRLWTWKTLYILKRRQITIVARAFLFDVKTEATTTPEGHQSEFVSRKKLMVTDWAMWLWVERKRCRWVVTKEEAWWWCFYG